MVCTWLPPDELMSAPHICSKWQAWGMVHYSSLRTRAA